MERRRRPLRRRRRHDARPDDQGRCPLMAAKKNAFAAVGWVVVKLAAKVGVPYAKRKVRDRRH
ncbi:hypothetical protein GCM10011381_03910 [Klenkia taihuensis]|nr:hypothetical protein GCM10011381_03910 [Klenkia taihuensis]